jgi:hypothetical protein
MRYGCIMCSASAYGMLSCFWLSAASLSPTRRCDAGARNSARPFLIVCAAVVPGRATSGTSTRYSFGSKAFSIICGVPLIRMVSSSIFWSRSGVTGKPPRGADQSGCRRPWPEIRRDDRQEPVLDGSEWRRLIDAIPTETVRDLRDRALIGTLTYSFARVGAALKLKVEDLRPNGTG